MILKVWRILTIPSVINQLKKLISREREQQQEHNELNAGGHRQLGQEETILIKQRNDILISIDAILNRASIPYFNGHDTIIDQGGIAVMLHLLGTFSDDMEMVHLIFQLLVTLMHEEGDKLLRHEHRGEKKDLDNMNRSNMASNNIPFASTTSKRNYDHRKTKKFYRTAKMIHHLGGKELIQKLVHGYQQQECSNQDIRILSQSISKDLFKAESFAAIEMLSQINEAVKADVSFETYAAINPTTVMLPDNSNISFTLTSTDFINETEMQNKTYLKKPVSPGAMAMDVVISNMFKFPDNTSIQSMGLDIILKCLHNPGTNNGEWKELFIDNTNACVTVLLQSFQSKEFGIKWRAHMALMKLTRHHDICKQVERNGGCLSIMNMLIARSADISQFLVEDGERYVYQLALWTLENLCEVDICLRTLLQSGLQPLLYTLMQKSQRSADMHDSNIIVPLSLQMLYPQSVLENASHFQAHHLQQHQQQLLQKQKTSGGFLPMGAYKKRPSHGTSDELFRHGEPGLV